MSVLDGFVEENCGTELVFITVTHYGLTFSKAAVESLGYPPYVRVYYDQKGRRMAVAATENTEGARPFVRDPDSPRAGFVRWTDKALLARVADMAGLNLGPENARFPGQYIPEENVLIMDLKKKEPVRGFRQS